MDRSLAAASTLFAAATAVGGAISVRQRIPGEPLRIHVPGTVTRHLAVGLGSGLSAPWPMPAATAVAALASGRASAGPRRVAAVVGRMLVAGVLVEPVTWGRRSRSPLVAVSVALNLASAAALIRAGSPARQSSSSPSPPSSPDGES